MSQLATEISLAERSYTAIRDMIVSLELPPGGVISERALMERLRVGRTPVREALRRLAQERLVDVYPRRGMFVTSVEIRDLGAISEIRTVLETYAARLAAERATDVERGNLRDLVVELDQYDPFDRLGLIELDQRIHQAIYASAHNDFLARTLEEHYTHALRIWHLALDRTSELHDAVAGHRKLLEAIADREPRTAARLMEEHIRDFEAAMRRVLVGGT